MIFPNLILTTVNFQYKLFNTEKNWEVLTHLCEMSLLMRDEASLPWAVNLPAEISNVREGRQIHSFCYEKKNFAAKPFPVQRPIYCVAKDCCFLSLFISFMSQQPRPVLPTLGILPCVGRIVLLPTTVRRKRVWHGWDKRKARGPWKGIREGGGGGTSTSWHPGEGWG